MIRRRTAIIFLVGFFALQGLGLALWVHLHTHADDLVSHQAGHCAICQVLVSTRDHNTIVATAAVPLSESLVTTVTPDFSSNPSFYLLPDLSRRGPPCCA